VMETGLWLWRAGVAGAGGPVEGVPRLTASTDGPQTRGDASSSLAQTHAADRHRVRHESRHVHPAEHLRHGTEPLCGRHCRDP